MNSCMMMAVPSVDDFVETEDGLLKIVKEALLIHLWPI